MSVKPLVLMEGNNKVGKKICSSEKTLNIKVQALRVGRKSERPLIHRARDIKNTPVCVGLHLHEGVKKVEKDFFYPLSVPGLGF